MSVPAATSRDPAATLELRQFTVRVTGGPWGAPLSLRSDARRVGLVGDWQPLFDLLAGRAEASGGSALILGGELESAIARGVMGFASCDVALPGSFTVMQYLEHAARLSHGSAGRAVRDARRALDRYGLSTLAKRKLAELPLYQRRALGIAFATLTEPAVVCLEAPLRALDAASGVYIARLCGEAAAHSRLLLSADFPSGAGAERGLLDACDELFLRRRGALVTHGAPSAVFAPGARCSLSVKGAKLAAFCQALSEAGVRLEPRPEAGRFDVELPSYASTDLLLDAALEHGLIVLELEPLFVS